MLKVSPADSIGQLTRASEAVKSNPALSSFSELLDAEIRVTLEDGRKIIGIVHALDSDGSIVLHKAEEWVAAEKQAAERVYETRMRWLGYIAVPGTAVVAVEKA